MAGTSWCLGGGLPDTLPPQPRCGPTRAACGGLIHVRLWLCIECSRGTDRRERIMLSQIPSVLRPLRPP
jgi:hypothetical protein